VRPVHREDLGAPLRVRLIAAHNRPISFTG
jgi:hypothetical protein